jgi:hypothetical protein
MAVDLEFPVCELAALGVVDASGSVPEEGGKGEGLFGEVGGRPVEVVEPGGGRIDGDGDLAAGNEAAHLSYY